MERVDLPLSELTLAQKLDLMEAIWDDLAQHDKTLESPHWHEQVLEDREEALAAGKATVSAWEEAKDRIRKNVSCE
ncbi:MAG: addiction module protein [Desulfomonile tiedjei]|uniref:Addiction module protein n=1 Tax=Desulfomonile tiedjei TaxID=2358 RepID=A0A9D6Z5Z2_9BACT|nr:addiction module protein [Desulfomonile tiedjei]